MSTEAAPLVEYLATTRMGEKGQVTVPKEYRDSIRLEPGAPMAILRVGDALILMPEQARFNALCDSISSALEGLSVTEADLQRTLPEARRRVFARRYPKVANEGTAPKRGRRR
jgi:AbrB family looped-hinge helix DNA binding protein